jgi:lipoyl synthase
MEQENQVRRKPEWLRIKLASGQACSTVRDVVRGQRLNTVCESAKCPNRHECWGTWKTATFMILGNTCTRRCRFCAVDTGLPEKVDSDEPRRVAESVAEMGLRHVVITMVTRDDLADGGASVVAETVRRIREMASSCSIEVLVSDLMVNPDAVAQVVASKPEINSHNLETVRRLTPRIRSRSEYERSLRYLKLVKELDPKAITKSSLMLGLGETEDEVLVAMDDLRGVGVDILNLGQYLQPTKTHAPVDQYWTPASFAKMKVAALEKGFLYCEAGPLVRSSYHAGAQYDAFLRKVLADRASEEA